MKELVANWYGLLKRTFRLSLRRDASRQLSFVNFCSDILSIICESSPMVVHKTAPLRHLYLCNLSRRSRLIHRIASLYVNAILIQKMSRNALSRSKVKIKAVEAFVSLFYLHKKEWTSLNLSRFHQSDSPRHLVAATRRNMILKCDKQTVSRSWDDILSDMNAASNPLNYERGN